MRFKLSCCVLMAFTLVFWNIGSMDRQVDLEKALKQIHVGMLEDDARGVMKEVSLNTGTVYFGGTGNTRVYFELPRRQQYWMDCERTEKGEMKVAVVGHLETKQLWVRHQGDSIDVKRWAQQP